ncbi:glycoside hydrolase family 31 protein [Clostridium sp. 'White wine YQ']|uniref:glycoside hydrolase family 31 protein n=1 Tax=Clostridium sp. 'White wine YQ' TaxID=3027474 RepID=UPI0023656D6D|nr:TIM-barrel domain-containing protein [Clostridium sp. 'White wine YQ']MDD7795279.1 glycoside hydrolase family 31 protein [Clostridium sp. 'White wine YQ']
MKKSEIIHQVYATVSTIGIYETMKQVGNRTQLLFTKGKIEVEYFEGDIVRIFQGEEHSNPKETSSVMQMNSVQVPIEESEKSIVFKGNRVITIVSKNCGTIEFLDNFGNIVLEDVAPAGKDSKGNIFITKDNSALGYYGFGEKGGNLNKKGMYIENYNTDEPDTDDESYVYYKTIPFFQGLKEDLAYGIFFNNSFRSYFDMGNSFEDRIFFGAVGGEIEYYFMLGNDLREVTGLYGTLTGKMDMPPLWSLGYQQCRYSYFSQNEVEELLNKFIEKEIPLDSIYLDIHYMDGYRVMTFDKDKFPDPEKMIKKIHENGVKVIAIVDPGVKLDEDYEVYNRGLQGNHFVKNYDGKLTFEKVWPGISAFPDFSNKDAREWWKDELKNFISIGIDGIWNDMNEPAAFNEEGTLDEKCLHDGDYGVMEHKEFHNLYGREMSRCSKEAQEELRENKRSFSMTRATFAGGQRYSSVWTGDNRSLWSQMRMSMTMNANLGMSGFSFVGNDIGGFCLDTNEELFIRWMELGSFLPIMRNHSDVLSRRQEPWSFGKDVENICRKFINLRYKLMPYIYNSFYHSYKEGIPVFRAMVFDYPKDMKVLNMKEQFLFGESILVAPVLYEGERQKRVYLPEGNWYNLVNGQKYQGTKFYNFKVNLDEILLFVKEGSIIPIYEDNYLNMDNVPDKVTLIPYGEKATGVIYEDDGISKNYKMGQYNLYRASYSAHEAKLEKECEGYKSNKKYAFKNIKEISFK